MKQKLLNTVFGHYALLLRARVEIVHAALFKPEIVGFLANDQIGEYLVTRLPDPRKTFVDIGAHIGSITSEVLYWHRGISVVAVEAIPQKAENLRAKFKNIEIHECALGDKEQEVSFYIDTVASGCSSLNPSQQDSSRINEITVSMKTLDQIVPDIEIDVIKIDVEGAELQVLKGGRKVIRDNRPLLYFESGSDGRFQMIRDLWNELHGLDYRIIVPNRLAHDDEEGLGLDGFLESHQFPRRSTNYFAVPIDRRTEMRDRARKILGIRV